MVNKLLAEAVSVLNGLFAFLTVVAGAFVGKVLGPYCIQLYAQISGLTYTGSQSQAEAVGVICGLVFGVFWAVLVYGLVALLIQMHRELKGIRQQLADSSPRIPASPARVEPRIPTLPT